MNSEDSGMPLQRIAMICVHTSPLAPMGGKKTGGMNVYIRELAAELGRRGYAVDIFTRRSSSDEPEIDTRLGARVRVVYLTAGPIEHLDPDELVPYLSEFTARLIAFGTLQNVSYDLIYSHYWLSGLVAIKLREAWGIPFVQMFHTLGQMKERTRTLQTVAKDNQRIQAEMLIVERADRLVAATPAEESQLLWLYRARPKRIAVIPPGVDVTRFQPTEKEQLRRSLGFERCHLLLFVGRIEPLKAVDSVLEALAILKQQDPKLYADLCFAIVGGNPAAKDPDVEALKALTHALGIEDAVRFLGAKDREELPLYYAAATAVLMPSEYESFGMAALEAMASGTPVIASNVGGLSYVVRDGETGFHVPVRDARAIANRVRELLGDAATRERFARNAVRAAQSYAWDHIADQLLTVFNDLLRGRR
jgi:D-inositol-3-phosphate glycosyltransferase